MPKDLRRSLVSLSISRGASGLVARAETSGTYLKGISTDPRPLRFPPAQFGRWNRNIHALVLSLALLLLQPERDTTDGTLLDTLHQVGGDWRVRPTLTLDSNAPTARDLVPETLRRDRSDLIEETLVGAECQPIIPTISPSPRPPLTRQSSHSPASSKLPRLHSVTSCLQFSTATPTLPLCSVSPMVSKLKRKRDSLEVEGETGVVFLDENARSALHGLSPDATLYSNASQQQAISTACPAKIQAIQIRKFARFGTSRYEVVVA